MGSPGELLSLSFPTIPGTPRELRPQTYSSIEDLEEFSSLLQDVHFGTEVHPDQVGPERTEAVGSVASKCQRESDMDRAGTAGD